MTNISSTLPCKAIKCILPPVAIIGAAILIILNIQGYFGTKGSVGYIASYSGASFLGASVLGYCIKLCIQSVKNRKKNSQEQITPRHLNPNQVHEPAAASTTSTQALATKQNNQLGQQTIAEKVTDTTASESSLHPQWGEYTSSPLPTESSVPSQTLSQAENRHIAQAIAQLNKSLEECLRWVATLPVPSDKDSGQPLDSTHLSNFRLLTYTKESIHEDFIQAHQYAVAEAQNCTRSNYEVVGDRLNILRDALAIHLGLKKPTSTFPKVGMQNRDRFCYLLTSLQLAAHTQYLDYALLRPIVPFGRPSVQAKLEAALANKKECLKKHQALIDAKKAEISPIERSIQPEQIAINQLQAEVTNLYQEIRMIDTKINSLRNKERKKQKLTTEELQQLDQTKGLPAEKEQVVKKHERKEAQLKSAIEAFETKNKSFQAQIQEIENAAGQLENELTVLDATLTREIQPLQEALEMEKVAQIQQHYAKVIFDLRAGRQPSLKDIDAFNEDSHGGQTFTFCEKLRVPLRQRYEVRSIPNEVLDDHVLLQHIFQELAPKAFAIGSGIHLFAAVREGNKFFTINDSNVAHEASSIEDFIKYVRKKNSQGIAKSLQIIVPANYPETHLRRPG